MRGKGEGSVFQVKRNRKDGTVYSIWCAEIITGVDEKYGDKKPMRKYFKTRGEAIEWKTGILADKQRGLVPRTNSNTVDQYYQHWIAIKKPPRIKIRTYESYQQLYRCHIKPALGTTKLQKLTTSQLNTFFSNLLKKFSFVQVPKAKKKEKKPSPAPAPRAKKTLSPATVTKVRALLSSMINTAITEGVLAVNPIHNVQTIKKNITSEIKVFSEDQMSLLLATAKKLQYAKGTAHKHTYHAVLLSLATGARLGEVMALKWDNIDMDKHTMSIKETIVEAEGGLQFGKPKSKASNRTISVDPAILDEIAKRKVVPVESEEVPVDTESAKKICPLVFHTNTDEPVSPRNMSRAFRALLSRCGLEGFRFHDLRHTHATQLLCQGVDISEVARRLGHDNPAVTLKVYAHFMPRRDEEAAVIMGSMLIKV